MPVSVIVPDASVILKWVVESKDEQDQDRALEIRDAWIAGRCAIVLPSLWCFEVGNILGMKQRKHAEALMTILIEYGFEEEPPAAIYREALQFMEKFRVTFYDAAYHVTAINHAGTSITSDETYYRKTFREGHIELLANWRSGRFTTVAE
jgi:predicted nucleic acid-binding protein